MSEETREIKAEKVIHFLEYVLSTKDKFTTLARCEIEVLLNEIHARADAGNEKEETFMDVVKKGYADLGIELKTEKQLQLESALADVQKENERLKEAGARIINTKGEVYNLQFCCCNCLRIAIWTNKKTEFMKCESCNGVDFKVKQFLDAPAEEESE